MEIKIVESTKVAPLIQCWILGQMDYLFSFLRPFFGLLVQPLTVEKTFDFAVIFVFASTKQKAHQACTAFLQL